jgi:hypothetical protein
MSDPIFDIMKCGGLPALRSILREVLVANCRVPAPPQPIIECDTTALLVLPPGDFGAYIGLTYPEGVPGRKCAVLGHAPVKIMHLHSLPVIPGAPSPDPAAKKLSDSGINLETHNLDTEAIGGDEYILILTIYGTPVTCTEFCLSGSGEGSMGDGGGGGGGGTSVPCTGGSQG